MQARLNRWDYLIVTASNAGQAQAYDGQLRTRREFGLLSDVDEVLVVADPGAKRIGSGGSTLCCLMEVLSRRLGSALRGTGAKDWEVVLRELRILIVHAGGDSRRLPAYGPYGKIFIPIPGDNDSAVCFSLFDRQLPIYLALPEPEGSGGQVVITSGDVLLRFEPSEVRFAAKGLTGLACYAEPGQASKHGVFCRDHDNQLRLYLQKPSVEKQKQAGAIDDYSQVCLDIGVMSFDAATAAQLLDVFGVRAGQNGKIAFTGSVGRAVVDLGVDFYREICCAMGRESTAEHYTESALNSGSKWDKNMLVRLFEVLSKVPFSMQLLKRCEFLDFGSSGAILASGVRLLQEDRGLPYMKSFLDINNDICGEGVVEGCSGWVDGCRINSSLHLGGENIVVGADIDEPLFMPPRACLDVSKGRKKTGEDIWFVRCYGVDDTFKQTPEQGVSFCGIAVAEWLGAAGAEPGDVWDADIAVEDRSIWNARMFPAVKNNADYRRWLWMYDVRSALEEDFIAWRSADRYSLEQILTMTDHSAFYERRSRIRATIVRRSLRRLFQPAGGLSASELAYLMGKEEDLSVWVADILKEAYRYREGGEGYGAAPLVFPRIIHTLGSALVRLYGNSDAHPASVLPDVSQMLGRAELDWLKNIGLGLDEQMSLVEWAGRAQNAAFEGLQRIIVSSGAQEDTCPRSTLRSDEIVWARAPARLDLGGGWTDTPPYSLEWGGHVVNAAVNLNGQPPIQAYLRVTGEHVIRIASIDLGVRIEIADFDDLMDYREATNSFALAKAALVLSGLSPKKGVGGSSLSKRLGRFGGGIELTTLSAIPKGSGLGTSSIMGAVIIAAIQRAMGRKLSQRELFHSVLRLEQALTTGGGWQDQIGGTVGGVKMIVTESGLVPDAIIHYVPSDILNPLTNGGRGLLYYTGITRLAKNILQQVVGSYLNRERATMATLRRIGLLAGEVMNSLICKDIERFGCLIDAAWRLNKQLDPNSSNEEIETLFGRVRPFVYGAKLLGAGGGGFMLMICKNTEDALRVRQMLEAEPPNERARFFDFDISDEGLTVTVC
jgi:galactokinase/mevalonate kinase-like predicted kinase